MDLKQIVKLCLQRELGPQVSCCQRLDLIYLCVIQFKDDNRSRRGIWEDYLDGNVVCVFILWQAAGGALKWKVNRCHPYNKKKVNKPVTLFCFSLEISVLEHLLNGSFFRRNEKEYFN